MLSPFFCSIAQLSRSPDFSRKKLFFFVWAFLCKTYQVQLCMDKAIRKRRGSNRKEKGWKERKKNKEGRGGKPNRQKDKDIESPTMHKNSPKNLFCLWVISSLNCHRIYWWLSNPPHRKRMAFPFPPPPLDFFWSRGISSSSSSRLEVSMPPPNAINITSENPQGRRGGRRGLSFFCGGAKKVPKEKSLRLGWKGEWRCERVFGISNLNPILLHPSHPTPLVSLTNFAASPPLSSMLFTSSTTCPIFGKALHASSFHERQKTFYDATHTSICLLGSLVEAPCLVAFFDYGSWRQKELVGWAGNWFPSPHPSTLAHLPTFPPERKKKEGGKEFLHRIKSFWGSASSDF